MGRTGDSGYTGPSSSVVQRKKASKVPLMAHESSNGKANNSAKRNQCCSVEQRSSGWVKSFLIFFTVIILIIALSLIGLGVYLVVTRLSYIPHVLGEIAYSTHFLLFTAGGLLAIACIIGLVGISKHSRLLLQLYTSLLVFILLLQIFTGILALCFSNYLHSWFSSRMKWTIQNNYGIGKADVDKSVDFVQQTFHCCGSEFYRDWTRSIFQNSTSSIDQRSKFSEYDMRVPDSCCIRKIDDCGLNPHPSNVFHDGCISAILSRLRDRYFVIFVVVLSVISIELFGIIFGCCYLPDEGNRKY